MLLFPLVATRDDVPSRLKYIGPSDFTLTGGFFS